MIEDNLKNLTEAEHEKLRDAIQLLLTNGAVLREEYRDLYEWCRGIRRPEIDSLAALIGLKLHWDNEHRLILALPQSAKLMRRLKQDETLLALALWYDFDRAVKDDGKAPDEVVFTVQEFNENLAIKFRNLKLPQSTRMREILQLFEKKSLIRVEDIVNPVGLAEAKIRVLPTIRFVIPFSSVAEWNRLRDRYVQIGSESTEDIDEP
jgi:hypothetical protein